MADTAGGNPGMNKLARVLQQRIKETMEDGIGDIEPDFGVIGKDGSLTTNMFPIPIPKGEYYLGRLVSGLKINISGGSHGGHNSGNGSHEHSVTLPKVKAGDAVLVTWVKNTIRRRLNIAKLNQDELKKKEQDENFQLTLKDLYELEKVKDIKTRDKILREATSSRDLVSRAQAAAAEAKRNENAKKLKEMLKKKGIKAAPKSAENEIWSGKWNTIKEYELDKDVPEQIKLPKTEEEKFFLVYYRSLRIITKIPKGKKELSPWEKEQKEKDQAKRKIKAILKESNARRKEFLENIILGKISPVKDESEVKEKIWEAMMALGSYIYASTVRDFYLKKSYYESSPEEKKAADESAGKLSSLHQMMIILHNSMKICNEPYDYNLVFNKNKGDALLKGYEVFEPYGWYFENEEERQVLDGTSELYRKEKKK